MGASWKALAEVKEAAVAEPHQHDVNGNGGGLRYWICGNTGCTGVLEFSGLAANPFAGDKGIASAMTGAEPHCPTRVCAQPITANGKTRSAVLSEHVFAKALFRK